MISYIGDISKADAEVLESLAGDADSILEFGCGASTQVIASGMKKTSTFLSIDTDPSWIEKTKYNLEVLKLRDKVKFADYYGYINNAAAKHNKYDFIFVDGVDNLRREFAITMWPLLKVGGIMAFHDTRRSHDFRNVLEVLAIYHNEVEGVLFNEEGSNISAIGKKEHEPYENWQITENRQHWQLGWEPLPQEFIDSLKKGNSE